MRSPITTKSSATIRWSSTRYLGRAAAQGEKGEYDAVIAGLDQLIRIEPQAARYVPGARGRLEAQEAVRQGDCRFDRSHPARPAKHGRLPRPRDRSGASSSSMTRRLPTTRR